MASSTAQHENLQTGHHPDAQTSDGRPLHLHLINQDEADITLSDSEEEKNGPLTEEQMKRERKDCREEHSIRASHVQFNSIAAGCTMVAPVQRAELCASSIAVGCTMVAPV